MDKAARPFDRFDFVVDGKINKLVYEKYDIQNSKKKTFEMYLQTCYFAAFL